MEPLYKGRVGNGSFVPYTVEPLSKGPVGVGPLSLIQWSLSTRDKLGWVLCPSNSGASLQGTSWERVLCPLYSGASLQGTCWGGSFVSYTVEPLYKGQVGVGPLSLIQWSLSTRDKLGVGPLSLILERLTSQR